MASTDSLYSMDFQVNVLTSFLVYRYNSFLDQINDGFYRPRGLYCMVLTWNPESNDMEVGVNINETIQSNLTPPAGIAQKTKHSLRPSMGTTNGIAFTETAPLVFPALDALAGNSSQEAKTQKEKLKSAANFTSEYFDRRAQAKYVCMPSLRPHFPAFAFIRSSLLALLF